MAVEILERWKKRFQNFVCPQWPFTFTFYLGYYNIFQLGAEKNCQNTLPGLFLDKKKEEKVSMAIKGGG